MTKLLQPAFKNESFNVEPGVGTFVCRVRVFRMRRYLGINGYSAG